MTNTTIPKSITRIKEEWNGMPVQYLVVVFICAAIFLMFGTGFLLWAKARVVFLVLELMTIFIFVKFLRTPSMLERSAILYQFIIRGLRGQNMIAKFRVSASFLESIIPVKAFYDDGLIEFIGNKYGLLMTIEPNRISDDEIDAHIEKVRSLIDSLHGDLLVKFFVTSMPQGNFKPLEKNIINIINKEERTKEQKDHLYSIYHQVHENKNTVIQWKFYLFLGLGTYKTLEEAKIAKQQYYPGFESRLIKTGVRVIQIKDKNALAMSFRQCVTQSGYI